MTTPRRAIDVIVCDGCAREYATGEETYSGAHECGLGRYNHSGGSPAYHARYGTAFTAAMGLAWALFGWWLP